AAAATASYSTSSRWRSTATTGPTSSGRARSTTDPTRSCVFRVSSDPARTLGTWPVFRVLFVLVVLSHDRRRLVHLNVTERPTADWTGRQLIEACGLEKAPRHLIRDRDQVYGERFSRQAKTLDIREAVIAPRSPWQNG